MQTVDLILAHATQLVTCACHNQPKRGAQMRELGLISDGALVIRYPTALCSAYSARRVFWSVAL